MDKTQHTEIISAKSFELAPIAKRLVFLAPKVAGLKEKHSLRRQHLAVICEYLRASAAKEKLQPLCGEKS